MTDRINVGTSISKKSTLSIGDAIFFPKESVTNYLNQYKFIKASDKNVLSKSTYNNLYSLLGENVPSELNWITLTIVPQANSYNTYGSSAFYGFNSYWYTGTGASTKDGNIYPILKSTNAINWTVVSTAFNEGDNTGMFIKDRILTSNGLVTTNGINWQSSSGMGNFSIRNAHTSSTYAVLEGVVIRRSSNGINWTSNSISDALTIIPKVLYSRDNIFYIIATRASNNAFPSEIRAYNSTNAINWTPYTIFLRDKNNEGNFAFGRGGSFGSGVLNNKSIISDSYGYIYNSTDNINWKTVHKTPVGLSNFTNYQSSLIVEDNKVFIMGYSDKNISDASLGSGNIASMFSISVSLDGENFYNIQNHKKINKSYYSNGFLNSFVIKNNRVFGLLEEGTNTKYGAYIYADLYNYNTTNDFVLKYTSDFEHELDTYFKYE